MADQVSDMTCGSNTDLRFVVQVLVPLNDLHNALENVSSRVSLTYGDSAISYGKSDGSEADAEDALLRTMNQRVDALGFPKGPYHWVAFEYELHRPNLVCIDSEANDTTLEKWRDLPLNARVVVTRGPLEEYRPHGQDIIEDLRLFAYSMQPPQIEIPAKAVPYRNRSSMVWFCNRLYQKKDLGAK